MRARALSCTLALALAACGGVPASDDGGRSSIDASTSRDAGAHDAASRDAHATDASPGADADAGSGGPVDATTMERKILFGYQGWFAAQGDGSPADAWRHWASGTPGPGNVTVEMWPDTRELDASELHATDFHYADGTAASLYSAYDPRTVDRHFAWMENHAIDGVFLQEFVVELTPGSSARAFRDRVTANVRAGAEAHGRVFALMYDISGADAASVGDRIREHWMSIVDDGTVTSDRYLHHHGAPVVAIWGFGFSDRAGTPAQAQDLIDWFHTDAPPAYRATVLGGVPTQWRTLDGDSQRDAAWAGVYRSFDVISPWSVGRYADDEGARRFARDRIAPDRVAASAAGAEYMPVIFPGFSWSNLMPGACMNPIPRRGGRFFWTQLYEAISAGATMIYGAMFDEVDEGTAMFEIAETHAGVPVDGSFLTLDAEGEPLPSDWYLRLAGEGARMLRGERALTPDRPIDPAPSCPSDTMLIDGVCVPSCGRAGGTSCDPAMCAGRPPLDAYDCDVCCNTSC